MKRVLDFTPRMYSAIIEGKKTVTRRPMKPQPVGPLDGGFWVPSREYYKFSWRADGDNSKEMQEIIIEGYKKYNYFNYPPVGKNMDFSDPNSCIEYFKIMGYGVEFLQDIDDEAAQKEGVKNVKEFKQIWQAIYGNTICDWSKNPLVLVVEFQTNFKIPF